MFVSIGEISEIIGVRVGTIRRWEKLKLIACSFRTLGNHRRFDVNRVKNSLGIETSELNRKVIDKGKISTPAGTFNCFVITYTSKMKSTMVNRIGKGKQWIAKGVGLVKEEDYNRKGSLVNSSVLTAFNKN